MPTIRVRKDKNNPYVMLNKTFLNDKQLSFKAKGLLSYLLSKPDDWIVYEGELAKASKEGRSSVRAAIRELIEAGYMERTRTRDEKGLLREMECNVYEIPRNVEALKEPDALLVDVPKTNWWLRSGEPPVRRLTEELLVETFQRNTAETIPPEIEEEIKREARKSLAKTKKNDPWKPMH